MVYLYWACKVLLRGTAWIRCLASPVQCWRCRPASGEASIVSQERCLGCVPWFKSPWTVVRISGYKVILKVDIISAALRYWRSHKLTVLENFNPLCAEDVLNWGAPVNKGYKIWFGQKWVKCRIAHLDTLTTCWRSIFVTWPFFHLHGVRCVGYSCGSFRNSNPTLGKFGKLVSQLLQKAVSVLSTRLEMKKD